MGMESFGYSQTKEDQIAEIDRKISSKKKEWRQVEERNYEARMNNVASFEKASVDFRKLDEGDPEQQSLKNAIEQIKKETQHQMDILKSEIDELEQEKHRLLQS
jgi:CYTH domain-containing protein